MSNALGRRHPSTRSPEHHMRYLDCYFTFCRFIHSNVYRLATYTLIGRRHLDRKYRALIRYSCRVQFRNAFCCSDELSQPIRATPPPELSTRSVLPKMDVSTLDPLSARVVIELELEDVNEAIVNQSALRSNGQLWGFRARQTELLAQLETLNAQIGDDRNHGHGHDAEDAAAIDGPSDDRKQFTLDHQPAAQLTDAKLYLAKSATASGYPTTELMQLVKHAKRVPSTLHTSRTFSTRMVPITITNTKSSRKMRI
ncbi:hypothetical protein K458DRAFT_207943 [Lentithecium fluviatile CBS 122367]|uniref:Uncharacterized protein n=1 Tax=Lentithecium fluviatile CBS 122367 TaxID=1168545 RepID=A0A6G1J7D3_9PLEO|nr:hypothetical protein K458DRAFT_207943 [Lentithecium fluviatile CBS 122367]